jgi:hypothetical protein
MVNGFEIPLGSALCHFVLLINNVVHGVCLRVLQHWFYRMYDVRIVVPGVGSLLYTVFFPRQLFTFLFDSSYCTVAIATVWVSKGEESSCDRCSLEVGL